MRRFFQLISLCTVMAFTAPMTARADRGADLLADRYQAALNGMVQKTQGIRDPEAKRAYLENFLEHMGQGLKNAETLAGGKNGASLTPADLACLHALAGKYSAYQAELNGTAGFDRVPDSGLDAFAGYIRQGTEQADVGGGIYLSGGVVIILLFLIILLIR